LRISRDSLVVGRVPVFDCDKNRLTYGVCSREFVKQSIKRGARIRDTLAIVVNGQAG
jgi:hypothetical protein